MDRIRRENRALLDGLNNRQATTREGFIYALCNPAWPTFVKVGRALDPVDRLRSYQTGAPLRDYELIWYAHSPDRYKAEAQIHQWLKPWWIGGEWFELAKSETLRALSKWNGGVVVCEQS